MEIKKYMAKDRTLRNTTRKNKIGGEIGVYGDRERAMRYKENQLRALPEMPNQLERR